MPALLHELLGASDGKDLLGDDPAGRVKGLLTSAGFREVKTSWVGAVADLPDPASAWEVSRTLSSSARLRLHAMDAEAMTQIRREFEAAGFELTVTHIQLFDCYRAAWADASGAPAGAVVGGSEAEAAVFAFSRLRRSLASA